MENNPTWLIYVLEGRKSTSCQIRNNADKQKDFFEKHGKCTERYENIAPGRKKGGKYVFPVRMKRNGFNYEKKSFAMQTGPTTIWQY